MKKYGVELLLFGYFQGPTDGDHSQKPRHVVSSRSQPTPLPHRYITRLPFSVTSTRALSYMIKSF